MNILAVDVGGTHVKFRTEHRETVKLPSGKKLTPEKMVAAVLEHSKGWEFDHVSIGFPGPVVHNLPLAEPHNLGKGWVRFKYDKAFGNKPLRMLNDAAMQALGSYKGGRMLFLGLGTGLGSALVVDDVVQAMEIAHLPWKKGKTYEDYLGIAALERDGHKKWRQHVKQVIKQLRTVLECEYVVLGGGNAELLKKLPEHVLRGSNDNAFAGAFKLWRKEHAASR